MFVKTDKIHLIGIGGYGMSGLAKALLAMGCQVTGSDLNKSGITDHLSEMGAEIYYGHSAGHIADSDWIIYSTAIPDDNEELMAAKERGRAIHRSEALAMFLNSKTGIAITGAHGKTTTSSMLALILEKAGLDPTAFIGGEVKELSGTAKLGNSDYVVAEADESDQTFKKYKPWYAVITNIEEDHVEHWKDFEDLLEGYKEFIGNVRPQGITVLCADDHWSRHLLQTIDKNKRIITFGLDSGDYRGKQIQLMSRGSSFNLVRGDETLGEVKLAVPGKHNILNAVAAAAVAVELGVEIESIQEALKDFTGVKRRFHVLAEKPIFVVDDYAHHPTEVKATLETTRKATTGRLIAVFQPHRYTRVRRFLEDFSLSFMAADIVLIDDIYAASEKPLQGVTAKVLAEKIQKVHKEAEVIHISGTKAMLEWLKENCQPNDTVITMGAGDIWRVSHQLSGYILGTLAENFLPKIE